MYGNSDDNDDGLHWVERARVYALVPHGHPEEADEVDGHVAHSELCADDQLHKPCSEERRDGSDRDLVHSFDGLFLGFVALQRATTFEMLTRPDLLELLLPAELAAIVVESQSLLCWHMIL